MKKSKSEIFLKRLKKYHKYVKKHGRRFKYGWDNDLSSFPKAKRRVESGRKASITCLVPVCWGLVSMGIRRKDGKWWISGLNGSFKHYYNGGIKKNFKRITHGDAIGLTVKQAVNRGLLKPGDIIAFKGRTHTFAYSGKKYIMFEGGHRCMKNGRYTGLKANYKNVKYKIGEILRWR